MAFLFRISHNSWLSNLYKTHTHIHKKNDNQLENDEKIEENAYSKNHGQRLHIKVGNLIAILIMLFPLILCGFTLCY